MHYEITTDLRGVASIKINIDDLNLEGLDKNDRLLTFPINKYINLYRLDDSGNHPVCVDCGVLDSINNFFKTISIEDQSIIAYTLAIIHSKITNAVNTNDMKGLVEVTADCAKIIETSFKDINLFRKFEKFIATDVKVVIEEEWGKRSIDTPDLTYEYQDVVNLHVFVFLGKLMTPIFGCITALSSRYTLGEKVAEIHCASLIIPLINSEALDTKNKLVRYIRAVLKTKFQEDVTIIHGGSSRNLLETTLLDMFLARNAVNHDVYRNRSNLITALNGTITKTAKTVKGKAKQKNLVEIRNLSSVIAEEQNRSQMEIDSILSKNTADIPIIARVFSDRVVQNFLSIHDLDQQMHCRIKKHLFENAIQVNRLSEFLLQSIFCEEYGGITNMSSLTIKEMSGLIAAMQQFVAVYGYDELAHVLTIKRTGRVKITQTSGDSGLLFGYSRSKEYRQYITQLTEDLPLNPKEIKSMFGEKMESIINDLVSEEYYYCTPPDIQTILDQPIPDGAIASFTEDVASQFCRVLMVLYEFRNM